jgi:hypothetical protein
VGFEADGGEVVASGDAHVGVEGGGQAAEQSDGGAQVTARELISDPACGWIADYARSAAASISPCRLVQMIRFGALVRRAADRHRAGAGGIAT